MLTRIDTGVLVVGAGASGLVAARDVSDAGLHVVVCEARSGPGGRIRTVHPPDGGPPIELGAQIVHGDRSPIHALIQAWPAPRQLTGRVVVGGVLRPMGALSRGVRPPWFFVEELQDSLATSGSVCGWLNQCNLGVTEDRAAREWLRQLWAADPRDLGRYAITSAARADTSGHGEYLIPAGFDALITTLGGGLDVRCSQPVQSVQWSAGTVIARTPGLQIHARAAVLTMPPTVFAGGSPQMSVPATKRVAAEGLPAGDAYCAVLTFDQPAPEDVVVFDVDGSGGFLRSWRGRPEVSIVAKAGAAARVRAAGGAPQMLAVALPWTRGAQLIGTVTADWGQDPYIRGAFTTPRPAARELAQVWAEPLMDTIFFAGEATTSGAMMPWVHAALVSGTRAAHEVIGAICR